MSPSFAPARQPSLFIPHGGGPCFFMPDPAGVWTGMAEFLRAVPGMLPERPSAIIVVSGHWETNGFAFTGAEHPDLIYDYHGFPPETYQLRYDAPGHPALAGRAAKLLHDAGILAAVDHTRGWDHGVFVPLKVAFPDAAIPVIEMSVDAGLDPMLHCRCGRRFGGPLRDEGVLILGSGMSFHNMPGYLDPRSRALSSAFDDWLAEAVALSGQQRADALAGWAKTPGGRYSHPREEHLIPLMVAAGAAGGPGERIYCQPLGESVISGYSLG